MDQQKRQTVTYAVWGGMVIAVILLLSTVWVTSSARVGTRQAVDQVSEFYLGELFYFFEFACGLSGYLLGVNPFNQPGVESYKKNMFALLGKPGFEEQREELLKRL